MKRLFDQNLPPQLARRLADVFPDSEHVRNIGLRDADDAQIWEYAKKHGFIITTKDTDFHQRSFLYGHPPKVIWLRCGNCSTSQIESILREQADAIHDFILNATESLLALQ